MIVESHLWTAINITENFNNIPIMQLGTEIPSHIQNLLAIAELVCQAILIDAI